MTQHIHRRTTLSMLALASLTLCALVPAAMAQGAFPNKPITLVVTYPPGGGADAMARLMAKASLLGLKNGNAFARLGAVSIVCMMDLKKINSSMGSSKGWPWFKGLNADFLRWGARCVSAK